MKTQIKSSNQHFLISNFEITCFIVKKNRNSKPRKICKFVNSNDEKYFDEIKSIFLDYKNKHSHSYLKKTTLINAVNNHLYKQNDYYYKFDIKNFFNSIDHAILRKYFNRELKNNFNLNNKNVRKKLATFLQINNKINKTIGKGILQGLSLSPLLSEIYMKHFDESLVALLNEKYKEHNIAYTRYADDILISSNKKIEIIDLLRIIENKCLAYKLSINYTKMIAKDLSLNNNAKNQNYLKYLGLVIIRDNKNNKIIGKLSRNFLLKNKKTKNPFINYVNGNIYTYKKPE